MPKPGWRGWRWEFPASLAHHAGIGDLMWRGVPGEQVLHAACASLGEKDYDMLVAESMAAFSTGDLAIVAAAGRIT